MSAEGLALSRTFTGQGSEVESVALTPSGTPLTGGRDGSIMIWNYKPQHRAYRLRGHTGAVAAIDVAPDESLFASGSMDHSVRLWQPSVRGAFKSFKAHAGGVTSITFSQDSKLLLTGSTDKMIKLWDMTKLQANRPGFVWCVHGHRNWVRSAHLSSGNYRACSAGDDKLVKVWDVPTSKNLAIFDDHTKSVRSAQFDALSGVCVASGGEDGTINLWDVRSGDVVQHYDLKHTPTTFNSLRFHPNGTSLLSVSDDAALRIWDLREGRLLYTVRAHTKSVNACTFSKDGNYFLTGGADSLVLTWNCEGLQVEPKKDEETNATRKSQVEETKQMDEESEQRNRAQKLKKKARKRTGVGSREYHSQSLGKFTRQAVKASMRNRMTSNSNTAEVPEPSAPPMPPPPPVPKRGMLEPSAPPPDVAKKPIETLAKALQVVEQRLRMNEEAVAEIQESQSQVMSQVK